MRYFLILASILAAIALSACGQKGPLVMPPKTSSLPTVPATTSTPVPASVPTAVEATQTKKN